MSRKCIIFILLLITPLFTLQGNTAIDGLGVKVSIIPGISKDTSPYATAFRIEMINRVSEVLETLLYTSMGKEQAYNEGRRMFKDYHHGTITVVDTKENLEKVSSYLDQLSSTIQEVDGSMYVKPRSKIINIRHADPNNIRNLINQIMQESRVAQGGIGNINPGSNYITGVIVPGAGNGLTFYDATVELIEITGQDTANAQARLYIFTPLRDREVTLSRGNSDLVDNYRIRLVSVDLRQQEAEIEIRLVGNIGLR